MQQPVGLCCITRVGDLILGVVHLHGLIVPLLIGLVSDIEEGSTCESVAQKWELKVPHTRKRKALDMTITTHGYGTSCVCLRPHMSG